MTHKVGKLIVFEGVDGTGKSTQIKLACEWLAAHEMPFEFYREPGGTAPGERIRSLLLDNAIEIFPRTELMLFFASRTQLAEEKVRPALVAGKSVILDRYYYSTAAYQGPAIPGGMDRVFEIARQLQLPEPDLVVCLDGDPEALASRRTGKPDRIEAKGLEYQKNVRKGYQRMASMWPAWFRMVEAARTVEEVRMDVAALLEALFAYNQGSAAAG